MRLALMERVRILDQSEAYDISWLVREYEPSFLANTTKYGLNTRSDQGGVIVRLSVALRVSCPLLY